VLLEEPLKRLMPLSHWSDIVQTHVLLLLPLMAIPMEALE